MAIGTIYLADTLQAQDSQLLINVGLDRVFEAIQRSLDAWNARVTAMFASSLIERSTDESRRFGTLDGMAMERLDETGTPRPQKVAAGATVGFPLDRVGVGMQWNNLAYKKMTVGQMNANVAAAQNADATGLVKAVQRAIFMPTNYLWLDRLARRVDIPVKALANADGMGIPVGPNGETFDGSTHTHYLARAGGSLAASDLDALINTVREHYPGGDIEIVVGGAQENAVRGFAGFVPSVDPRIVQPSSATFMANESLGYDYNNRTIGLYNGAVIKTKPWSITNYLVAYSTEATPLVYRYDPDYGDGLQVLFEGEETPWNARGYHRIFGVGVWERTGAAVLYAGGTTYVAPTI